MPQRRFVVLSAVEDSMDDHCLAFHGEGDGRAATVPEDSNPFAYVVPLSSALRKDVKSITVRAEFADEGLSATFSTIGCDVTV